MRHPGNFSGDLGRRSSQSDGLRGRGRHHGLLVENRLTETPLVAAFEGKMRRTIQKCPSPRLRAVLKFAATAGPDETEIDVTGRVG